MTYQLMPQPLMVTYTGKICPLNQTFIPRGSKQVLERLASALAELPDENGACPISFTLEEGFLHEEYHLVVDEKGANINA
jgi:hypothetical protein